MFNNLCTEAQNCSFKGLCHILTTTKMNYLKPPLQKNMVYKMIYQTLYIWPLGTTNCCSWPRLITKGSLAKFLKLTLHQEKKTLLKDHSLCDNTLLLWDHFLSSSWPKSLWQSSPVNILTHQLSPCPIPPRLFGQERCLNSSIVIFAASKLIRQWSVTGAGWHGRMIKWWLVYKRLNNWISK